MAMLFKPLVYTQEQVQWLETRGMVYQLLMDFLSRPPRMSLIAQWRRKVERNPKAGISKGGRRLMAYLESIPEEGFRSVCHQEAKEYERLFSGREAIIPSCESLFRSRREGAGAMACSSEVRKLYMDNAVVFNKLNGERDDHIALELEFMAVLAEGMLAKANLQQSCLALADAQIHFLESHLLKWAQPFAQELLQATKSPLFTGLAEMMDEFLVSDLQQLRAWRESQPPAIG
ncbi:MULTISPECIES: TorD/DmsD family molecular chaperone [Paenibacillus]|uniref:TorD/DmsD family molecular chaperone n=1 Tax=Paenibacillus TaxID=44249 RepID=UPI00073F2AAE|nr:MULTISPECIES: molecular chaperone TorD family protein [Paenibacillus]MDU4695074.1 molecular chaperone TorD family protein [Paenibacillus sp.]